MSYRGVLLIADYKLMLQGSFQWKQLRQIHEEEVFVPAELIFSFAEIKAIKMREEGILSERLNMWIENLLEINNKKY